MDEPYTVHMRDPWSLTYSEYEQELIEALNAAIGPKHPLYQRNVYPMAARRDPWAVLFHAFDDGFYAIVYFSGVPKGPRGMPKTEIFADYRAVGEKVAADHAEQLELYKRQQGA